MGAGLVRRSFLECKSGIRLEKTAQRGSCFTARVVGTLLFCPIREGRGTNFVPQSVAHYFHVAQTARRERETRLGWRRMWRSRGRAFVRSTPTEAHSRRFVTRYDLVRLGLWLASIEERAR